MRSCLKCQVVGRRLLSDGFWFWAQEGKLRGCLCHSYAAVTAAFARACVCVCVCLDEFDCRTVSCIRRTLFKHQKKRCVSCTSTRCRCEALVEEERPNVGVCLAHEYVENTRWCGTLAGWWWLLLMSIVRFSSLTVWTIVSVQNLQCKFSVDLYGTNSRDARH